jgi:hypothetical protein
VDEWFRGDLGERVRADLVDGSWPTGAFDERAVGRLLDDHRAGRAGHKWPLWHLVALQWWARNAGLRT